MVVPTNTQEGIDMEDLVFLFRVILFIFAAFVFVTGAWLVRVKLYMDKHPPLEFEKNGDHVKGAYFKRIMGEIRGD